MKHETEIQIVSSVICGVLIVGALLLVRSCKGSVRAGLGILVLQGAVCVGLPYGLAYLGARMTDSYRGDLIQTGWMRGFLLGGFIGLVLAPTAVLVPSGRSLVGRNPSVGAIVVATIASIFAWVPILSIADKAERWTRDLLGILALVLLPLGIASVCVITLCLVMGAPDAPSPIPPPAVGEEKG